MWCSSVVRLAEPVAATAAAPAQLHSLLHFGGLVLVLETKSLVLSGLCKGQQGACWPLSSLTLICLLLLLNWLARTFCLALDFAALASCLALSAALGAIWHVLAGTGR